MNVLTLNWLVFNINMLKIDVAKMCTATIKVLQTVILMSRENVAECGTIVRKK